MCVCVCVCWGTLDVIWATELVLVDCQNQLLVPLPERKPYHLRQLRGIALLSIPGKVFVKAILNRLKPRAEQLLCESQCGFRRSRGCADQLFSLRLLMERARQYHHSIYVCFIDLKRHMIWSTAMPFSTSFIIHINCLPSCWAICALHENSSAVVKAYAYGKVSNKFPATNSVRQGCVLAHALFNLYFDIAYLHDADLVGNRKSLRFESVVTDLEYADNMAHLSDNSLDLTTMLHSLSNCCKKLGLAISCKKDENLSSSTI